MEIEIQKEKWNGSVREVTIGATEADGGTRSKTITVGGEATMPFLSFEGAVPRAPMFAMEIKDRKPDGWSPLLYETWGDAMNNPGEWASAAEAAGADMLVLYLSLTKADGEPNDAANVKKVVREVLDASSLPLAVFGPGQSEQDNELIPPAADEGKGERLLLGICEDKNYRTIVASAMANGHVVNSRAPMDVNLSKQLVILMHDMGLPLDRILMDPSTGALAYGIEYGYSVMERLRLAALQGDSMTQQPIMVGVGEETWKVKEAKVGEGVPESWGDWNQRAVNWETFTAAALVQSGADIVALRHPESLARVRAMVSELI